MRRPAPVFLARRAYRYRRLQDAARLLPFAGLVLFLLPILWQPAATAEPDTGRGAIYLFLVWALLIAAAFLVSRRILGGEPMPPDRAAMSGGPQSAPDPASEAAPTPPGGDR